MNDANHNTLELNFIELRLFGSPIRGNQCLLGCTRRHCENGIANGLKLSLETSLIFWAVNDSSANEPLALIICDEHVMDKFCKLLVGGVPLPGLNWIVEEFGSDRQPFKEV